MFFLAFGLIFVALLFVMKISITMRYKHDKDDDRLTIVIRFLWGLVKIKKEFPSIKVNKEDQTIDVKSESNVGKKEENKGKVGSEDVQNYFEQLNEIKKRVVGLQKIVRRFLKHVQVTEFRWKSVIGIKDAALTGIICGSAWAIKGSCITLLDQNLKLKIMPEIEVIPFFFQAESKTDLTCILSFRMGHAMGAAIRLLTYWRGSKRTLVNKPQPLESKS